MLDRHPAISIALDPLMPLFRSLRNAIVQSSAPRDLKTHFDPDSPFQDFYFNPDGPVMLDVLLQGDANLPVGLDELSRLRKTVPERAALESRGLAGRLRAISGNTYAELIESALGIIAATKPAATWAGCKEVWIFDFIPLLARAFPQAQFYAIERDPRAIVASLLALAERDSSQAAHPPSYMRHWRKSIALSRWFEADATLNQRFRAVSYEALVTDPAAAARRVCTELQVDYGPEMLALSADGWTGNSSFSDGKDVYASSVERWRKSLPTDVQCAVEYLCGPEMVLTSYRKDSTEGREPEVKNYLQQAESAPVSWRSSSGNPDRDFAGELMRYELLEAPHQGGIEMVRRCFLFAETLAAIRRARNDEARTAGGVKAL